MQIEWTKEERYKIGVAVIAARNASANETDAAAQAAVSLFLARASGQVKEDARTIQVLLARLPDHRFEVCTSRTDGEEALSRLLALAQEAQSLREEVGDLERAGNDVRAERDAARADLERLNELRQIEHEAHEREKRERERTWESLKAARAEVARLKGWREKCNNAWAARLTAAETSLAAVRECLRDMAAEDDTDAPVPADFKAGWHAARNHVAEVLGADAPTMTPAQQHEDIQRLTGAEAQGAKDAPLDPSEGRCASPVGLNNRPCYLPPGHDGTHMARPPDRYPCSPTCTHDDAANPGHPQRMRALSTGIMVVRDGVLSPMPERAKKGSEAIDVGGRRPENDGDTFTTIENGVEGTMPITRTQLERYAATKAEAMRAACLKAALVWAQFDGASPAQQAGLKTAIERATP